MTVTHEGDEKVIVAAGETEPDSSPVAGTLQMNPAED